MIGDTAMRLDDLDVSDEELRSWARAIEKSPTEEFNLDELPFGKLVVNWLDQTMLALLEHGRRRALNEAVATRIALRATALSRLTQDPRPLVAFKIGERLLLKFLSEFGCRI
jgi:hypothetical protein